MNKMGCSEELKKLGDDVAKCLVDISEGFKKAAQLVGKSVDAYGINAVLEAWDGKIPARFIRKLLMVYEGRLLPYFVQHPELSSVAMRLSREEQQHVADDKGIRVWTSSGVLMVKPSRMEPKQKRQVFGPDGIRDEGQQRIWVETQPQTCDKDKKEEASVRFDPKKGLIVQGSAVIPPAEIMRYAGQIAQKLS